MKKDSKQTQLIAWIALGVAIGTSVIRLYLLTVQNSSNVSSATIDLVSNIGYVIAMLFVIWYAIRKYKFKKEHKNGTYN